MAKWPDWWEWELEFSPHLLKRMLDRGLSDVDVRLMIEGATGLRQAEHAERWVLTTTHDSRPWVLIVEPDSADEVIVVITAYQVSE